ncbi:Alpha/Beta hydrolase protein [Scheffersomyces amazonensis]|uniref:Alpha/Beta hydrolase protein n=1 Tax=Scheffersomyces amazonensis TaxID=1078765 RepID=UPI00315C8DE5
MLKNRIIEYELFRAILSNDVYVLHPNLSASDREQEWNSHPIVAKFLDTTVNTNRLYGNFVIHELYLENNTDKSVPETHIVIIHGFMAALGYFLKNVEALIKSKPGVRLHVIDLPGFGNSSRPQFPTEFLNEPPTTHAKINQIIDVENWFIDQIENWRIKRNIPSFKLIGHSMGAYLSSCYLMKYNNGLTNNIVEEFIVVSPMGTESSSNSLISDKKYEFNTHEAAGDPFQELDVFHSNSAIEELWNELGRPKFPQNSVLRTLWRFHVSPFQVLQYFGPFYSKILSYWSFRRFRNLKNAELILKLHNYSYSIFNQYTGSGELAITKFISCEVLAKLPLGDRGFVDYLTKNKVKTLWLYGDKDWMNSKGGKYIADKLKSIDPQIAEFKIIDNAGHHIYLDNPDRFNKEAINYFNLL